MELVEVNVVLQGLEVRTMEVLNTRINDIQKETESAVAKAVAEYDFDAKIGEIVTGWLDEKIESMANMLDDGDLYNIEGELFRTMLNSLKAVIAKIEQDIEEHG